MGHFLPNGSKRRQLLVTINAKANIFSVKKYPYFMNQLLGVKYFAPELKGGLLSSGNLSVEKYNLFFSISTKRSIKYNNSNYLHL